MTTLSRTFASAEARDAELRWTAWQARGAARAACFRRRAIRVLWLGAAAAASAAAVWL